VARARIELGGCAETVCVAQPDFGAAVRFVAVPGTPTAGSLAVPGIAADGAPEAAEQLAAWAAGALDPLIAPAGSVSGGVR
jgi:penicillin G amidase